MGKQLIACTLIVLAGLTIRPALASKAPWEEYEKLIKKAETIGAHGPNLFGDEVNLQSGGLSFRVTDVSIPGNNALPVEITRTFSTETIAGYSPGTLPDNNVLDSLLGDWDLDLPSISAVFPLSTGWINPAAGKATKRCAVANTAEMRPSTILMNGVSFQGEESWHGTRINIPGRGSKALLLRKAGIPQPGAGGAYFITGDWTSVGCVESIQNGSGQGFVATTTDGTRYWFDWMARADETRLTKRNPAGPGYVHLERGRYALYATKVQDRFGNTVEYTYANSADAPVKLTRIESSDGRVITLAYTGSFVSAVSAHGRTWNYAYTGNRLTTVTLPDATAWSIDLDGFKRLMIRYFTGVPTEAWRGCGNPGDIYEQTYVGSITHPSGAIGQFTLGPQRFERTGMPSDNCAIGNPGDPNDDTDIYPSAWDSYSLLQKVISGPAIAQATWNYVYWNGNSTEVFGPLDYQKYTYGNSFRTNEGKLLSVQRGANPSLILTTTTSTYNLALSGTPYYTPIGDSGQWRSDSFTEEYPRPMLSNQIAQQGATFLWQVDSDCAGSVKCFDAYARPTKVTRSSSLGYSRTDITEYDNNLTHWVLGQVRKTTCTTCVSGGIVESETVFDSLARPVQTKSFGQLQQTLTYYAGTDPTQYGTVATVSDGRDSATFNTTIALSSWKCGTPRLIAYPPTPDQPEGESESATVNDDGTIASVTDELGYTTVYDYDAMGRLSLIDYPDNDDVDWANTQLAFARSATAAYGLPVDHWRHTVHTGNGYKVTYYDAMWRPVVEEAYDSADAANTRSIVVKRYDSAGRLIFQSYPVRTLTSYADTALKGTKTFHDALDRVTRTEQNWEMEATLGPLVTTTEYLTGFQTRVTNARGYATTIGYQAYDQPTTDWPVALVHPAGAYTDIARDDFGKPTWVRRRNAGNTVSSTRYYTYYGTQELCRVDDPESGVTAMGYDGAGNLAWSASGIATSAPACLHKDWVVSRRADRTYDQRGRLDTLSFYDGLGNQDWDYEADGKVSLITTANADAVQVVNSYTYNKRRLLAGESMAQPGYTWALGYGFNALGHVAVSLTQPGGEIIGFDPNALGQARKATSPYGDYATNVTYHPNGAISAFDYGNGISHRMDQNERGLPEWSVDFRGSSFRYLDDVYQYDKNGNVARIDDELNGLTTREMTYDDLDRLETVTSPIFTSAAYQYDVLDNLTRVQVGQTSQGAARGHYYCYNAQKQLDYVRSGPACTGTVSGEVSRLEYDPQGNVKKKGTQPFVFDLGNRLREATGKETYRYDGHGRRVMAHSQQGLGDIRSIYGNDGVLRYQRDDRRSKVLNYIYLGGSLVAVRETPYGGGPSVIEYQHTDALGSPVLVTDANRATVEQTRYEPYGKVANRPATNGPGYTGHVMDAATALNYMQQRYYDPGIGRFLSVDPVTAYGGGSKHFNRYWYATGNPYRFYDPDGRCTGSRITNDDGTCKSTGEFTTKDTTAVRPQTITSAMVKSVGPNQATQGQVNTAVKDANAVGRTAKAAGDSRAVRAFNKLEGIAIDSSNWDVATYQGGSVAPTSVAYALFNSKTDRGSIVLGAARYFDGRGDYHRAFRFMHEVFHFDTAFNNQRIFQQAAGCVGWSCQFERDVEVAARETMNAGWAKRDEGD